MKPGGITSLYYLKAPMLKIYHKSQMFEATLHHNPGTLCCPCKKTLIILGKLSVFSLSGKMNISLLYIPVLPCFVTVSCISLSKKFLTHNHLLAFLSGRSIFTYRDVQLLTGVKAIQYYAGIIQVLLHATHVGIV